jgi:hypothetical protein
MALRKLSDSDKSDIIELYRQPNQTTSTLAEQYGVSNSTISRILKTTLAPAAYSELISQKRLTGSDKAGSDKTEAPARTKARGGSDGGSHTEAQLEAPPLESPAIESSRSSVGGTVGGTDDVAKVARPKLKTAAEKDAAKMAGTSRRRRKSSRTRDHDNEQLPLLSEDISGESTADTDLHSGAAIPVTSAAFAANQAANPLRASSLEDDDLDDDDDDLLGLDEALGDDFGDDDDLDDDDDDDDDLDDDIDFLTPKLQPLAAMEIMPLGEAVLPKPCYLVVDMRSELITRPLSDFADLGQIPSDEEKAKTLPVFDNHRVARRFSRSKQRVIKVPDGNLISRTSPYLQAKGITRLLVDGRVFDLVER